MTTATKRPGRKPTLSNAVSAVATGKKPTITKKPLRGAASPIFYIDELGLKPPVNQETQGETVSPVEPPTFKRGETSSFVHVDELGYLPERNESLSSTQARAEIPQSPVFSQERLDAMLKSRSEITSVSAEIGNAVAPGSRPVPDWDNIQRPRPIVPVSREVHLANRINDINTYILKCMELNEAVDTLLLIEHYELSVQLNGPGFDCPELQYAYKPTSLVYFHPNGCPDRTNHIYYVELMPYELSPINRKRTYGLRLTRDGIAVGPIFYVSVDELEDKNFYSPIPRTPVSVGQNANQ